MNAIPHFTYYLRFQRHHRVCVCVCVRERERERADEIVLYKLASEVVLK